MLYRRTSLISSSKRERSISLSANCSLIKSIHSSKVEVSTSNDFFSTFASFSHLPISATRSKAFRMLSRICSSEMASTIALYPSTKVSLSIWAEVFNWMTCLRISSRSFLILSRIRPCRMVFTASLLLLTLYGKFFVTSFNC